jgi:hypothetical protein
MTQEDEYNKNQRKLNDSLFMASVAFCCVGACVVIIGKILEYYNYITLNQLDLICEVSVSITAIVALAYMFKEYRSCE